MDIKRYISHRRGVLIIAALILIGLAIFPFESSVVPQWSLQVVDETGNPCRNMPVNQSWADYSLYFMGGFTFEERNTDDKGFVEFQDRTIRASGARRVIVPPIAKVLTIAHGSYGVDAAVSANGLKDVAWLSYKPGEPLPNLARVERCITKEDLRPKPETSNHFKTP